MEYSEWGVQRMENMLHSESDSPNAGMEVGDVFCSHGDMLMDHDRNTKFKAAIRRAVKDLVISDNHQLTVLDIGTYTLPFNPLVTHQWFLRIGIWAPVYDGCSCWGTPHHCGAEMPPYCRVDPACGAGGDVPAIGQGFPGCDFQQPAQ